MVSEIFTNIGGHSDPLACKIIGCLHRLRAFCGGLGEFHIGNFVANSDGHENFLSIWGHRGKYFAESIVQIGAHLL